MRIGLEHCSSPIYMFERWKIILKFYEVDNNYIIYIKNFERQIPDFNYDRFNKFVCGIVLNINDNDYFAPVSSFKQQQRTNFVILDRGRPVSSIRFSFMFPAPNEVIRLKDFSNEPQTYKDLINAELRYCNNNRDEILRRVRQVYRIGCNRNHPLANCCCDFTLLESKCNEFIRRFESNPIVFEQTAATSRTNPPPEE